MGDGFLATFDGPRRALRAANELVAAARRLGLEVRAGVHTGEVEVRSDDVGSEPRREHRRSASAIFAAAREKSSSRAPRASWPAALTSGSATGEATPLRACPGPGSSSPPTSRFPDSARDRRRRRLGFRTRSGSTSSSSGSASTAIEATSPAARHTGDVGGRQP